MKIRLLILICLTICSAQQLSAQESGGWWPFSGGSGEETRQSSFFNGGGQASEPMLKMPSLNPFSSSKKSATPKGPSTFSKITSSSKRMFSSTVDFLNPFDSKPQGPQRSMGYQPQLQKQEKRGMFSWLWPKNDDPGDLNNVNDFLSQPRPRF